MMAKLKLDKCELSILLTNDNQIQKLNRDYRQKDRPTDVLAFAMREGEPVGLSTGLLGDVVISVPTAFRQASALGRSALDEVTHLLAHGLLHLLGWDHQTDAEDRRMRRKVLELVKTGLEADAPASGASSPRRSASNLSRPGSANAKRGARGGARKPK